MGPGHRRRGRCGRLCLVNLRYSIRMLPDPVCTSTGTPPPPRDVKDPFVSDNTDLSALPLATLEAEMRRLEKLMSGMTITLAIDSKGELQAPLVPNSLLGWLARAALKDVCEKRLHACSAVDCAKLFVSANRRARFCSDRCKSRIHKREVRRGRPRN